MTNQQLLLNALKEARELVEHWGAYASAYFQEKWDLAGDLAKLDDVIRAGEKCVQPADEPAADPRDGIDTRAGVLLLALLDGLGVPVPGIWLSAGNPDAIHSMGQQIAKQAASAVVNRTPST